MAFSNLFLFLPAGLGDLCLELANSSSFLFYLLFPAPNISWKRKSIYSLLLGAPAVSRHLTAVLHEHQSDQVNTRQFWVLPHVIQK